MHGGDIYSKNIQQDFSVNINPLGIPRFAKKEYHRAVKNLNHYPDYSFQALKKAFSDNFQLPENVFCFGNGASELICAVIRALNVKKALLISPSFTGYRYALKSQGAEILHFQLSIDDGFALTEANVNELKRSIKTNFPDILILANPNNPDGNLIETKLLKDLLTCCKENSVFVLLDECFIELSSAVSDFYNDFSNVIILRAFTKSLALPGLRFGWCVSTGEIAEKIRAQLPEWNVSVPAQEVALAVIKNQRRYNHYLDKSRRLIRTEKEYLKSKLSEFGFQVFSSDANFLLFYSECKTLKEHLEKYKILIRDCSDYDGLKSGFYRIAVKKHSENKKLIKYIKKILTGAENGN